MSWIQTIDYSDSGGRLRHLYDQVKGPGGAIDNIMRAHSLRPHTMEGHLALYRQVLHHSGNRVPLFFREAIGVYVSALNRCGYCVAHHSAGLARLLAESDSAASIIAALQACRHPAEFDARQCLALDYARLITQAPGDVAETVIAGLRAAGWEDGEILEINQISAYFAYANRTVLGLGVSLAGDVLGQSPADATATP